MSVGLLYVVSVQHYGEEEPERTRWQLCGRFLLAASAALVPPRVAFATKVGTDAPNICIESTLFLGKYKRFQKILGAGKMGNIG